MAKVTHVTEYNRMMAARRAWTMIFTIGAGSMADKERVRGWVVHGCDDTAGAYAKFFMKYNDAVMEAAARV